MRNRQGTEERNGNETTERNISRKLKTVGAEDMNVWVYSSSNDGADIFLCSSPKRVLGFKFFLVFWTSAVFEYD